MFDTPILLTLIHNIRTVNTSKIYYNSSSKQYFLLTRPSQSKDNKQIMQLLFLLQLLLLLPTLAFATEPLKFEFQQTIHSHKVGDSVHLDNGILVAYNGSHTRVLNTNLLKDPIHTIGYWAWESIETVGSPPDRTNHSISLLDTSRVLMHGGQSDYRNISHGYFTDTWVLEIKTNPYGKITGNWIQIQTNEMVPRTMHAMASLSQGSKSVLMYGGWGGDEKATKKEMKSFLAAWIFKLHVTSKNQLIGGSWKIAANGPHLVSGHTLTTIKDNAVILFGGSTSGGSLGWKSPVCNSTFVFDLNNDGDLQWKQIAQGHVDQPGSRFLHAASYLQTGQLLMSGGFLPSHKLIYHDTWILHWSYTSSNGIVGTWNKTDPKDTIRNNERLSHHMVSISPGYVYMYGGKNAFHYWDAAFVFQGEHEQWDRALDGPTNRDSHGLANLGKGNVLLFGGSAKAYNTMNHKGAVSNRGGVRSDSFYYPNRTWIYQGYEHKWSLVDTQPMKPNGQSQMASIVSSGRVLLFGGVSDWQAHNGFRDDTFIFDTLGIGSGNWIGPLPIASPLARVYHTMVSFGNNSVLLFGGCLNNLTATSDIWIYTDQEEGKVAHWKEQKNHDALIKPRATHGMANLDRDEPTVMVFGGCKTFYCLEAYNDLWTFDLTIGWKQITKPGNKNLDNWPKKRGRMAMTSLQNGKVIMYGGYNGKLGHEQAFNDVWVIGFKGVDVEQHKWKRLEDSDTRKRQFHVRLF